MNTEEAVKRLIDEGVFDPFVIFDKLYPSYVGHYAKLRQVIHEVKTR